MQAFRPALWRQVRRAPSHRSWYGRAKHDNYGPHKEYFQTPGQAPIPEPPPYTPLNVPRFPAASSGPSLLSRAFRSTLWAILFGTIGAVAGTALISWEYVQPPFAEGSPEDQDLFDEILETLDGHSLVESLREQNWVEEKYYPDRFIGAGNGLHLVGEKLFRSQGIVMRAFKHPVQNITMMVFFLGFGIEGWPDVVHGGVITTLLQEGVDQHVRNFHHKHGTPGKQSISIDFKRPMRPGEIYAVLIPPAMLIDNVKQPFPEAVHLMMHPELLHIDTVPRKIPTTGPELHAVATVAMSLVPNLNDAETTETAETDPTVKVEPVHD